MKNRSGPNEFSVIVDRWGDVVDKSSLNDDVIWACVRMCDGKYPDDSPHVPWYWNGTEWREWRSKIHSDKGG